jgi:predicted nucleotidyltransferase
MEVGSLEDLALNLSADWPHLKACREAAKVQLGLIEEACKSLIVPDTSLVVFGSLARLEFTQESDVDWTLLLDGFTVPEHLGVARKIADALDCLESKPPGRTGIFGNMASSHGLIHYIGGDDDTNANTTRRVLLLIESSPVGDDEAYNRVRNNLLKRYLEEDLGLWRGSTKTKVPHFLLNDFARYWRTMAVDFADKQHDRFYEGFALRNIKLRLSRKLLYIAGLLACFRCHLQFPDAGERIRFFQKDNSLEVAELLRSFLDMTPLDLCAQTLSKFIGESQRVKEIFTAYNEFLGVLSDRTKREILKNLGPSELEADPVYAEARTISHRFNDAVRAIFLRSDNPIGELTIRYGVF